jgi:superfamily II DNA or RNA helicase
MNDKLPAIIDNREGNTLLAALQRLLPQAEKLDVATGMFEIGSLLALDPTWQRLKALRVIMGDETTRRTRKELVDSLTRASQESIEQEKERDDSLSGLSAIREALDKGRLSVRLYPHAKFHAKAYLLDMLPEALVNFGIVGSSNFTRPGLTVNLELNLLTTDKSQLDNLKAWYEGRWGEGEEVRDELLQVIASHLREFTPFEVYATALYEYFLGREKLQDEWERTKSKMYPILSKYQQDGYHRALQIAEEDGWNGTLICDGVGLGKTFIGLMLLEHYIHEGKRVLLIVPYSARKSVWERYIEKYLKDYYHEVYGQSFTILNHTDFGREGTIKQKDFEELKSRTDVIIVDEAHHFRHAHRTRCQKLYELSEGKKLFFLTATPINNSLDDLYFLICYFVPRASAWKEGRFVPRQDYFARIGIQDLRRHFNEVESRLSGVPTEDLSSSKDTQDFLSADDLLRAVLIQRSRRYVKESEALSPNPPLFPERQRPHKIEYSLKKVYAGLYDDIRTAFSRKDPLLSLAAYNPEHYKKRERDEKVLGSEKQVIGLIRTLLLKRLESSYKAFEASLEVLLDKMAAFLQVNAPDRLETWRKLYHFLWENVRRHQAERAEAGEEEDADDGALPLDEGSVLKLDPVAYDLEPLLQLVLNDMTQLATILSKVYDKLTPEKDDKLLELVKTLRSESRIKKEKVVIFTEYRDTARYLFKQLRDEHGFTDIEELDSTRKVDRVEVIKRFSPYYNCDNEEDLKAALAKPIRVLISTDVLSEGLNLQDANVLINYDLHWNPVRLMQRIGRVDRRLDPEKERLLGREKNVVWFFNFLPPGELEELLRLFERISGKVLRINRTLGMEGALLTPDDEDATLKEFNEKYEGGLSVEEVLKAELQMIETQHPGLYASLAGLPRRLLSGKRVEGQGVKGLFCAYRFPVLEEGMSGEVRWYYRRADNGRVVEGLKEIADCIRSQPETPRFIQSFVEALKGLREEIERHVKNTHLRAIQAPQGYKPVLVCWMEVS